MMDIVSFLLNRNWYTYICSSKT